MDARMPSCSATTLCWEIHDNHKRGKWMDTFNCQKMFYIFNRRQCIILQTSIFTMLMRGPTCDTDISCCLQGGLGLGLCFSSSHFVSLILTSECPPGWVCPFSAKCVPFFLAFFGPAGQNDTFRVSECPQTHVSPEKQGNTD